MLLRKTNFFDGKKKKRDGICSGSFSFTACRFNLTSNRTKSYFRSPLHPAVPFDFVHRFHDLRRKRDTYFKRQYAKNLHVPDSIVWWDSCCSTVPWEMLPLPRTSSRHLHVALRVAQCPRPLEPDSRSVVSLD